MTAAIIFNFIMTIAPSKVAIGLAITTGVVVAVGAGLKQINTQQKEDKEDTANEKK